MTTTTLFLPAVIATKYSVRLVSRIQAFVSTEPVTRRNFVPISKMTVSQNAKIVEIQLVNVVDICGRVAGQGRNDIMHPMTMNPITLKMTQIRHV
mmetsp:Transcript_20460/g.37076  ORF Transcript_20460/g.37076 Transcript_20460/m.37076 type:complete len:95 (+) Transcript_20460:52-336(+)|eukprot:CAMPEP_0198305254 /NCGR_PEP_ID=MMETSP1449-20131203/57817_1 /TAXON_ID=420275 /ORGANISM="Attheya septentrionalis, Strain CCMP2084" /LENGTH=94 /DNA_ID=CAMNT_0044007787 /DNA_START=592 /DNA_END=876 /DNA_ORIENTATION=-